MERYVHLLDKPWEKAAYAERSWVMGWKLNLLSQIVQQSIDNIAMVGLVNKRNFTDFLYITEYPSAFDRLMAK